MRIHFLAAGLVAVVAVTAPAQAPKADTKSAVPADVVPANFRAFLVTDNRFPPIKEGEGKEAKTRPNPLNRTGKIHCLVCENGLAPVVAVFVRTDARSKAIGTDSGVIKLAKGLNALIPKYRSDKLAGFVMFLNLEGGKKTIKIPGAEGGTETTLTVDQEYPDDENRDTYVNAIRDLANAASTPNVPFGLAPTKSDAISAWKIGDKDDVTVIIYYRMRTVGQPFRFAKHTDLTDEKVAEILKAAESVVADRE